MGRTILTRFLIIVFSLFVAASTVKTALLCETTEISKDVLLGGKLRGWRCNNCDIALSIIISSGQ
jgi:hypothetical protein